MLRSLLAALAGSPTASSLEIRSSLGLGRETFEQLLGHLERMGYVAELADLPGCTTGESCHGCALACPGQASSGRPLRVTPRGHAFLARLG